MAKAGAPLSSAMRSGGGIHVDLAAVCIGVITEKKLASIAAQHPDFCAFKLLFRSTVAENPATEMFGDDDDPEPQFAVVDNYQFDDNDGPTCFSILPLKFDESDEMTYLDSKVDLHGHADSGLYKVHKKVVAWRVQFDYERPIISVLSSEGNWIELLKPRKRYENTVRSILIAVQMLHYVTKWPRKGNKSLFDHLCEVFNKFDNKPAEYDLKKHKSIIKLFAEMNPTLMKSKILQRFIEGTSWKKKKPILKGTGRKKMTVSSCRDDEEEFANYNDNDYNNRNNNSGDDYNYNDGNSDDDDNGDGKDDSSYDDYTSNNDDDINTNDDVGTDHLCAICDNGGKLLSCVGRCKRAFHPRKKDGRESNCETLGFSSAKLQEIDKYLCKNCEYKQHQCFKCGKLEPSNGPNAKVFQCYKASCGHFYHPSCVAKLLEPRDTDGACELEKRIAAGMSFTCPAHWCSKCETMEDNTQLALWLAACRRCPITYHKKCLPSKISFTEKPGAPIRAWRLGDKIIIYCEHHKMVDSIGTPRRDHIKLPFIPEIDRTRDLPKKKANVTGKRKKNSDQGLTGSAELSNKLYREEGDQTGRQRVAMNSLTRHIVLKERGVPKKDTIHSNQVPIDELDNLIVEEQDGGDENNYKTGKEIETHRENVCGHDLISGQKEISIRENLMGASTYDHDSSLGQEKIPWNKSNKVGSPYGGFTPDQVDYLPPEKQAQAACLDKETATNIIDTPQECGRDFEQEVEESYACQHELKSPRCNDNSKAIEIYTSDKQSRKREEPKEHATDCKMLDSGRKSKSIHMKKGRDACCEEESPWCLDNQKEPDVQSRKRGEPKEHAANSNMPDMDRSRNNIHMEKGRDAFCDESHRRLDSHKEPDVLAYNLMNNDLNCPRLSPTQNSSRYNDDQRATKTSEYKPKEGRGVNNREERRDYKRVNSFRGNSHMGRRDPQKRSRDHSPDGRRMNYHSSYPRRDNHHRYEQRRVADYSRDGDRRRWRCPDDYSSDYDVGRGSSPQQSACSPKFGTMHSPTSYPTRAEHRTSIKRGSSSYLRRSEHVTSRRRGPSLYPRGHIREDYAMDQRAALVPRDPPNDEYTNVEHGHHDVMDIPPIDRHSSHANYTGAYGPQTDTSMDQPAAVYGGRSYGVRSDYRQRNRLHLEDRASASGSVMERYTPRLERTNRTTGGLGNLSAR